MNASLRAIYILAAFIAIFLGSISAFNYIVDPLCFFRCDSVMLARNTTNLYYQVAQRILAHPDAEQIVLGSSRGESIPLKSLESETGLKTLNLSVGGSELKSKLAYLNFAIKNLKLKRVIWIADYFETLTDLSDPRLAYSPALNNEVPSELKKSTLQNLIGRFGRTIDRQTIEASLKLISDNERPQYSQGINNVTLEECLQEELRKNRTTEVLSKEVDLVYNTYTNGIFVNKENPLALQEFEKQIKQISDDDIEIVIFVPPYNPRFSKRLEEQYPAIYQRHLEWRKHLSSLNSKRVRIVDNFTSIPNTEDSPKFWSDGVHFTCAAAQLMIHEAFQTRL